MSKIDESGPSSMFEEIERKVLAGEYPESVVLDIIFLMEAIVELDAQFLVGEDEFDDETFELA